MTESTKQTPQGEHRKLIAGLFISLDGVTEAPNEWQGVFDEEMGEELGKSLSTQDALLMGRKLYEEWSNYWPTHTDDPFAEYINNIQKYVVSTTLKEVKWGEYENITLFNDLNQVRELKERKGQNIGMSGSVTLVRSLLRDGLLDELFLMIHPVVVGNSKQKLFDGFDELKRMKLTYSKTTESGTLIVKYTPLDPEIETK